MSDFSVHPYVVLPVGSYVHDGNVYCGSRSILNGYEPEEGHRIIVMPVSGPWDHKREVMAVWHPVELFLVGEPDETTGVSEVEPLHQGSSAPGTLHEFRDRLWVLRNRNPVDQ